MYAGVPMSDPMRVTAETSPGVAPRVSPRSSFAIPKSSTLTRSPSARDASFTTMMFSGLRSR